MKDLEARMKDLERAIIDANEWLEIGEGVSLGYYFEEAFDVDGGTDRQSMKIIEEILSRDE